MSGSYGDKKQPLEGLVVLDFTRYLPGPVCTMLLADYGAEVLKIEDTRAGDPTRYVGNASGKGALFRQLNRNKKSIAIDLKDETGKEVIKKMAARADLLVEGFRPGVMKRLGLCYNELSKVNRQLVYVSISGYGQKGLYRDRSGHDLNYSALTGLLDLSAAENDPPVMPAVQIADIGGGSLMALNGILIALFKRDREGKGDFVDVSMARGLLPFLTYPASGLSESGELPRKGRGMITGAFACYNLYETADSKYMSLGALEPEFWQRFCEAVGKPEWVSRQFAEENRAELIEEVQELFRTKSRREWEEIFVEIDACCDPVLDLNEAMEHPLAWQEGYWLDLPDGDFKGKNDDHGISREEYERKTGEKMPGFPLLFSGQGGALRLGPPGHGEHTAEVLRDFGFDNSVVENLRQNKVIK
ncbi:MAG: CaiB/BaiF CoA-transferase family protein [Bacillota bacterium]